MDGLVQNIFGDYTSYSHKCKTKITLFMLIYWTWFCDFTCFLLYLCCRCFKSM